MAIKALSPLCCCCGRREAADGGGGAYHTQYLPLADVTSRVKMPYLLTDTFRLGGLLSRSHKPPSLRQQYYNNRTFGVERSRSDWYRAYMTVAAM